MRIIKVTFYWKSGLHPAHYYFNTWLECFTWVDYRFHLYREDIATIAVKYEDVENADN